ncbi:endosome-associated-trafficking regulator 1-like isoform X2 [Dermacentor albipictus]|uniref:endosome-associated-trafficking regulator 1-like isoform X2 n=1 Tax=Dermacentor albipictus TaxID=60249 RepID=UPI0038FC3A41
MAAPSDNELDEQNATSEDANPFSFQRFVNTRSTSSSEYAPNELGDLITCGQNVHQTRRKCLLVVDDKPKGCKGCQVESLQVAHIKRPQSLDIIAHLSSVPARRPSSSDDADGSYSSSTDQVNVSEPTWLQEPLHAGLKAQYEIDRVLTERLEEKNKQLQRHLEEAQKVNKEQSKRLKSLEEQLVLQQAREREETAALERMVQQVECNLKTALERASTAEELAYSLKQEVKALQARCKHLEMQQNQDLSEMTSDLSCKLRTAADSAEGSLRDSSLERCYANETMRLQTMPVVHSVHSGHFAL